MERTRLPQRVYPRRRTGHGGEVYLRPVLILQILQIEVDWETFDPSGRQIHGFRIHNVGYLNHHLGQLERRHRYRVVEFLRPSELKIKTCSSWKCNQVRL